MYQTVTFTSPHARRAEMLLCTDDRREQRPQLCAALTGELKQDHGQGIKPWSAAGILSIQAPSTHNKLSVPNGRATSAATADLSADSMKQACVQVAGTGGSSLTFSQRDVNKWGEEQCMVLFIPRVSEPHMLQANKEAH